MTDFRAAFHESGHVVAAYRLGRPIGSVKLNPDGTGRSQIGGLDDAKWRSQLTPAEWSEYSLQQAIIASAGMVAEVKHAGRPDKRTQTAWDGDMGKIRNYIGQANDASVNLESISTETRKIVSECWDSINQVACHLLLQGKLDGADVERICAEHRVPSKEKK